MKKIVINTSAFVFIALLIASASAAEQNKKYLTKNPFVKPKNIEVKANKPSANSLPQTQDVELSLRATLTSPNHSIANVNGEMLSVGDEIEGHKLINIEIGKATLLRGKETITLEVHEKYQETE